ncbi:MAG TPA: glycerate kinase [Opitutaceae bacterium]|jgi:glycerate kinase|nr:glycerate kinase [Opitutaceae bacterium]
MRILVAFDKFKGALTAPEACDVAAAALQSVFVSPQLDLCPLADGGDGFASVLTRSMEGEWIACDVTGPSGQRQPAAFGIVAYERIPFAARNLLNLPAGRSGKLALIEMAAASGLASLPPAERDPWTATSAGTGELIRLAAERSVDGIVLGIGGSATNDVGLGALAALGARFLDAEGALVLPPTPNRFSEIVRFERTELKLPPIRIACDVTHPLLGAQGATRVFGPQKGLRPEDADRLEQSVAHAASLLCSEMHITPEATTWPGTGAAGGLGFGLKIALGAALIPGADLIAAWLRLDQRVEDAELILTGEGRFDSTSFAGKAPGAIVARALRSAKPLYVFAGQIGPGVTSSTALRLRAVTPPGMSLSDGIARTRDLLRIGIEENLRADVQKWRQVERRFRYARWILGLYQMAAAVAAFLLLSQQLGSNLSMFGLVIIFAGLSFATGVGLIAAPKTGWRLTALTQAMQAFGFFSPFLTYVFVMGAGLTATLYPAGTLSAPRIGFAFNLGLNVNLGLAFFKSLPQYPTYGVTINGVAAALAAVALLAHRHDRRPI